MLWMTTRFGKQLGSLTFLSLILCAVTEIAVDTLNFLEKKSNNQNITGNIVDRKKIDGLRQCAFDCMLTDECSGIIFKKHSPNVQACKHIVCGHTFVNITDWPEYEFYMIDLDLGIGVRPQHGWTSGKPDLYFPFDSDTGTRLGPNSDQISFIDDAIIGKSILNPSNGNLFNINSNTQITIAPSVDKGRIVIRINIAIC